MSKRKSARAIVQITVEIHASSHWGEECTVKQVDDQAVEIVTQALRNGLVIDGLAAQGLQKTPARIVGTPKVSTIIVSDE